MYWKGNFLYMSVRLDKINFNFTLMDNEVG